MCLFLQNKYLIVMPMSKFAHIIRLFTVYMSSGGDHNQEKDPFKVFREDQVENRLHWVRLSPYDLQHIFPSKDVEANMKENNSVPAHHPSSLNIHTIFHAKFHIQAQWDAMG